MPSGSADVELVGRGASASRRSFPNSGISDGNSDMPNRTSRDLHQSSTSATSGTAAATSKQWKSLEETRRLWPARLNLFFGGRGVSTGLSPWPPLGVLFALCSGFALLFAFPVPYFTRHHGGSAAYAVVGAVLAVCSFSFYFAASLMDPGILPRCGDLAAPEGSSVSVAARPPRKQHFVVHGSATARTYCDICAVYRPPRAEHCSLCNNCVTRFDHHCAWIGNCVGERNYRHFFGFLISSMLGLVYSTVLGVVHLVKLGEEYGDDVAPVFRNGAGSIVLVVLCVVLILAVVALLIFHLQLSYLNRTTYEHLRVTPGPLRPEGQGVHVLTRLFFGKRAPSYVKSWLQLNRVNPSFSDVVSSDKVYSLGNESTAKRATLSEYDSTLFFRSTPKRERPDHFQSASSTDFDQDNQSISKQPAQGVDSVLSYSTAPNDQ